VPPAAAAPAPAAAAVPVMVKVTILDELKNSTTFNVYLSTGLSKVFSTYAARKGIEESMLSFHCKDRHMNAKVL
jgi:hypothetical protein